MVGNLGRQAQGGAGGGWGGNDRLASWKEDGEKGDPPPGTPSSPEGCERPDRGHKCVIP